MKLLSGIVLAAFLAMPLHAEESLIGTIQQLEDEWAAAYNAHDLAKLLGFYEVDAVLVAPGAPPAYGHEAIGEVFRGLFPLLIDLSLVTDEVRTLGENYAIEIGHSTYQAVSEDGKTSAGSDNYEVVWHRGEDGVWHYVTDMFNSR